MLQSLLRYERVIKWTTVHFLLILKFNSVILISIEQSIFVAIVHSSFGINIDEVSVVVHTFDQYCDIVTAVVDG